MVAFQNKIKKQKVIGSLVDWLSVVVFISGNTKVGPEDEYLKRRESWRKEERKEVAILNKETAVQTWPSDANTGSIIATWTCESKDNLYRQREAPLRLA